MLESLAAVDHCHLDELLHAIHLNTLVSCLQFGQLLIGGVEGNLELDVLEDGCLGLRKLLKGVLLL